MSWLKALEKVRSRAAVSSLPQTLLASGAAVAGRLAPAVNRDGLQRKQQEHAQATREVGPSTAALHSVSDTWGSALAVIRFSQSGSQRDQTWNMHHLPLSLATQCLAVLVEAGQTAQGVELMQSWQRPEARTTMRAKIRATARMRKTLRTLGTIGDVETLRTVVSVLHQSLTEQRHLSRHKHHLQAHASSSEPFECAGTKNSYPLLSALGMQRTRLLLVEAVHELVMQDESVVPVFEKLTWINATAVATTPQGAQVQCLIPFMLQDDFGQVIESSPSYDESLLQQIGPAFHMGFAHPTQCGPVEIISMPRSEIRRLYRKSIGPSGELWKEVKDLVLPHSLLIQQACQIATLVDVLCSPMKASLVAHAHRKKDASELTKELRQLRKFLITQLCSSRSLSRRMWSCALLRHPRLLYRLNLSPIMVFCALALTFRSFQVHIPFVRCCLPLLRRLKRMGHDEEAARLVWNHLSVNSPALAVVFRHHPLALEDAVTVVCRTMRTGVGGRKEAWMGHRSLAVLRVAAASGRLTPAHCIPACAAALDCGVHFATVQQLVGEVFGDDNDTARWVLNMVRLTTESHTTRRFFPLVYSGHSVLMRSLLRKYACESDVIGSPPAVELHVPSRSKLLALWTMVHDDVMSMPLRRLICRLFLDDEALMDWNKITATQQAGAQALNVFFREEVLASMAANCTTEGSYVIFMDALLSRRRLRDAKRCMQLLLSELDDECGQVVLPSLAIEGIGIP
ncbi:hypothetical protein TraAM80_06512 [Trypanosoma rangeli]|uniref:Uncharacterized protein n=1 Tax=Trypanosoma rangeli TaxID=5698 RepID=A0A3S5IQT2_TRYRA|nr:uncharacterized protein TraAM80_06512 [Trypanosoma rangeli]RNF02219.1 hypothetical protein TraAM80_06512 [Trypanosoma rangeli]|eukprot:RNF02219.1 hypothetical protein TraAM80_06512 [Trypanosoma rangeli]